MRGALIAAALLLGALADVRGVRPASTLIVQDLGSAEWEIESASDSNGTEPVAVGPVSLPVMVLQALYEADMLEQGDPLAGYNDRTYRWVAEQAWTFQADFEVDADVLMQERAELVLSGVDTAADVFVNDRLVGQLNNAHREWRLDVKGALRSGMNLITLAFQPAPQYARSQAADYPYPVPSQTYIGGFDNFNFIRKAASDFGWDWGPAFAPTGVYGNITLQAYSAAHLTGASIRQRHNANGTVDVWFDAVLQAAKAGEAGRLTVAADERANWTVSREVRLQQAGENVVTVQLTIEDGFRLWWPAGWGEAALYGFTLSYAPADGRTSRLRRNLGLRTIELVQEPLRNPDGTSFYFRVNGLPLYARGANMIPLDVFEPRVSDADLRDIVGVAVGAGMNMLRVWGGGRYPRDAFYDACDAAGVLVWQEAMFGCAQYPRDRAFLANVGAELRHQARRVGHHASLALWGGNNEVEASFQWFPETRAAPQQWAVDFTALFVEAVQDALRSVDPTVNYVDTSPTKGLISADPYVKRWGSSAGTASGDVHFYDYSSNCFDKDMYPRAKFVSEHGFQSFPSFPVYRRYTEAKDWSVQSNMSDYRQRHPNGNAELMTQMQYHYEPIGYNATQPQLQERLFRIWIYLTQVQQAQCYETAFAQWRRLKAAPDAQTMGILYWQLNDIWAGPSWSGIDYGGHWRLSMYSIKKVFQPVLVSGFYNATTVDALAVYVTNDQPWEVSGNVTIELIPWAATDGPLAVRSAPFRLPAFGSSVAASLRLKPLLRRAGETVLGAVVRLRLSGTGDPSGLQGQICAPSQADPFASDCAPMQGQQQPPPQPAAANESYASQQTVWLTEPKAAALPPDPRLTVSDFQQTDSNAVSFKVSSGAVAAGVQLESGSIRGVFSENNLLVLPWEPVTVSFRGRGAFQAAAFARGLSLLSLADTLGAGSGIPAY